MNLDLEKSILSALVYFDIFNYPLTLMEAWRYRLQATSFSPATPECSDGGRGKLQVTSFKLSDIAEALNSLIQQGKAKQTNGMYFLPGREKLVDLRLERYNIANAKFKKAKMLARFAKLLPWAQMIAVTNKLAYSNEEMGGDIDLFVVTKQNRIWTTRFFLVGFLKILNLRPTEANKKDKFCLPFFVDENHLNLESLTIDDNDLHFAVWTSQFVSLFSRNGVWEKFIAQNEWVKKFLPDWRSYDVSRRRQTQDLRFTIYDLRIGSWAENFLQKIQMRAMPKVLKEAINVNTNVIIREGVLKFHLNDKRTEYRLKWQSMVKLLNY